MSKTFGLACTNNHPFFQDGAIVCGREGCNCRIPVKHVVIEMLQSGMLSLDDIFKAGAKEYYNMPSTLRRFVNVSPQASPLVINEVDIAAIERRINAGRDEKGLIFLSELTEYRKLAPERATQFQVSAEDRSSFVTEHLDRMRAMRRNGTAAPSAILQVMGIMFDYDPDWTSSVLTDKDWQDLSGEMDGVRQGRNRWFACEDKDEEESTNRNALSVMGYVLSLKRFWPGRAADLLTREDERAFENALAWNLKREDVWNALYTLDLLSDVSLERAKEHLKLLWPRVESGLIKERSDVQEMLRALLTEDHDTGNHECMYLGQLPIVHSVSPELLETVTQGDDWLLLMAELEHWRGRRNDIFHVAHLQRMKELEPVYARFFTGPTTIAK
jgi:hypothetical protein